MGLFILRYCLIGLAIFICFIIGILHRVPPVEGLLTVLILVLIGIFFQNERQVGLLNEVLKEIQKK